MAMLRNLRDIEFTDRQYVVETAKKLLLSSKGDAYLISMPLIVSAQLGDEAFYQEAHDEMLKAMTSRKNDTFTAWLYGRMLLAANSIENKSEDKNTASKKLKELIDSNKDTKDCFRAWAFAYLATADDSVYQAIKMTMKIAAEKLTDQYTELKKSSITSEKDLQEARSNALWGWVMVNFAAVANAPDKGMYDYALKNMCNMMGTNKVAEALAKGLLRTSASNDYPAWALGIIQLTAARINDDKLFKQLQEPLRESIEGAKSSNAIAETVLAIVNRQLAIENSKLLNEQRLQSTTYNSK